MFGSRRWNKALFHFTGDQTTKYFSPASRSAAFGPVAQKKKKKKKKKKRKVKPTVLKYFNVFNYKWNKMPTSDLK